MNAIFGRLVSWFERSISIDTRSLGIFRIGVGFLILVDALLRVRNFTRFYTSEGVLPLDARNEIYGHTISIFNITGDPGVIAALFVVYFLLGLFVLIGYQIRFVLPIAFFFVISLDIRNPFVMSYADIAFRIFLFWSLFMPLGERYSIDAIHRDRGFIATYSGVAAPFMLIQVVSLYFLNGMHKLTKHFDEWLSGETMVMIFHFDSVTFLLGPYLREFEGLLHISGLFWFSLMLFSPLLIIFTGRKRYLFASLYAAGHLFLAVTVRIGAFPFVSIAGLVMFCQKIVYDDIHRVLRSREIDLSFIFVKTANIGCRFYSFLPYPDVCTYVSVDDRTIQNMKAVGGAFVICFVLIIGMAVVAQNAQNLPGVESENKFQVQDDVEVVTDLLKITQPNWAFYYGPVSNDRYMVVAAETESGEVIDPYNGGDFSFDRPYGEHNHKQYDTYRDRFYTGSLLSIGKNESVDYEVFETHTSYFCDVESTSGKDISHVNVWIVEEEWSIDNVGDRDSYNRTAVPIGFYNCSGGDPIVIDSPDFEVEPESRLPSGVL